MSVPNKHKHLTREQREAIEEMLNFSCSFKHIASQIDKDPTTVSKEVKRNSVIVPQRGDLACANVKTCALRLSSATRQCPKDCSAYSVPFCSQLKKAPFVCNGCTEKAKCRLQKAYYRAKDAQADYKLNLSASRQGINLDAEVFGSLNAVISAGVKKGQAPAHIIHTQGDSIPVSERTVYRYFEENLFSVCNIDLPRKVRYKPRKKAKPKQCLKKVLASRDYIAFQEYIAKHPDTHVVETDTVYGSTKTTLLTFHFCNAGFMLTRLIPDRTDNSVNREIDKLQQLLAATPGAKRFEDIFSLLLADNGKEFEDTLYIETGAKQTQRTKLFYCDPYSSFQKPHVEKNHEHIRQILPKGVTFDNLTQADVDIMMSHINSYSRDSLNGKTPYEIFSFFYGEATAQALGIVLIDPKTVTLKSALLRKS
ncbi:MAG: IS30 family transposase [Clostridiales bacterium]|jgi:IS30 family transposase|nr:IS30 family transposase [Clostridiales bacterium]